MEGCNINALILVHLMVGCLTLFSFMEKMAFFWEVELNWTLNLFECVSKGFLKVRDCSPFNSRWPELSCFSVSTPGYIGSEAR